MPAETSTEPDIAARDVPLAPELADAGGTTLGAVLRRGGLSRRNWIPAVRERLTVKSVVTSASQWRAGERAEDSGTHRGDPRRAGMLQ